MTAQSLQIRKGIVMSNSGVMHRTFRILVVLFFLSLRAATADDFRMISILENERMVEAEPDIRLVTFFQSKDPAIRARSILASGRIGNKAVIAELCPHAIDKDLEVRKMTAFALGQIRAKEGLSCLPALLKDADAEVRRLAIEAAGRIGGLEATSLVLPFLEDRRLLFASRLVWLLPSSKTKHP